MNELKSYTEYAVSTPTADFVIGFDFNYGEDAVNVTVDDVPATEAGYTVVYLNETTIRLSPSVPSGVVRLQRETDIDQTDHAYRAGAKFIAQTMDENFEQLRHSQQEVRDGFNKLSEDTHEIIEGLDAALELAQDAAQDAQDAAVIAQGAADTVNTIIVGGKVAASNVLDASAETQQQVNYNGGSKWHSRVGGYKLNERVSLTNGDIVKSTVDANVNDPNVDMTGWDRTGLYAPFEVVWKGLNRVFYEHAKDYVNVLDYGAINDGAHHTIQEWIAGGKFSDLADIQTIFPKATALTDCVNTTVFQYLVDIKKIGYAPKGTYAFIKGKSVHTPHSGSPNRIDSGGGFFGDGCLTIFTQLAPTVPSTDEDTRNNEAIISMHGSYVMLKDITFNSGCIGVYLGQDLTQSELSSVYLNSFENLQFRNMGRGILSEASGGNHYNKFDNIHFIQCQVDCRMVNSSRSVTQANNNRNKFTNIRSNRSIVGLWCSAGDTNRFDKWDGEGCGTNPNSNPFNGLEITGLPVGLTTCVHIVDGNGQLNKFSNCQMEACEVELYSANYANTFIMNGYHENEANGTKVYMPTAPAVFISAFTLWTPAIKQLSNINLNAFPSKPNTSTVLSGTWITNDTGYMDTTSKSFSGTSYTRNRIYELKDVAASATVPLSIWGDVDANSAASFDIIITGRTVSSNLSFATKVTVSALRSGTRSLTRYYSVTTQAIRATGQSAGDTATVISATVVHGGTSTRELLLQLTMPPYAMSDVAVWVNAVIAK